MTYRVFASRHYIAVRFFDIEAESEKAARSLAERAANKICPDARAEATDNTWLAGEAEPIVELGLSATGKNKLREVLRSKRGVAYVFDNTNEVKP